jgi:hypothetical protein
VELPVVTCTPGIDVTPTGRRVISLKSPRNIDEASTISSLHHAYPHSMQRDATTFATPELLL